MSGTDNVVDLLARAAERIAWERRAAERVLAVIEGSLAEMPEEATNGDGHVMLEASAVLLRHGLESDDPELLERMARAMSWLADGRS